MYFGRVELFHCIDTMTRFADELVSMLTFCVLPFGFGS